MIRSGVSAAMVVVGLGSICGGVAPASAATGWVWDQSRFIPTLDADITGFVVANDFTLTGYSYLQSVDIWLADAVANDNGLLDGFSGRLDWKIYSSTGSAPNALLRGGRGVSLQLTDTGLQTAGGSDMIRVHFDLEPPVALDPGVYWFGLHEGPWGISDGTVLRWLAADTDVGSPAAFAVNSGFPFPWAPTVDPAMVLYSGFQIFNGVDNGIAGANELILANVAAADFYCDGLTRLTSVDVWLADGVANDNGIFDSFGGTLGWGLLADQATVPGLLLASGSASPKIFDSLLQDTVGADIFRARLRLPAMPALQSCAGWNWFALHEGAWGSGNDGSPVYWQAPLAIFGEPAYYAPATPNPTGWMAATYDTTIVLFDDLLFASGFEAGVACAWTQFPASTCP